MPKSLLGTLFLVFLVCKLAGVTDIAAWSWWTVFSPLIAQAVVIFAAIVIAAGVKR